MNSARTVIGIDVGGTNLRFALVRDDAKILSRSRVATAVSWDGFLRQLTSGIASMCGEAEAGGIRVDGIGIGMPGLIDPSGVIISSVNLSHCEGKNLAAEIGECAGVDVTVANDANAAAIGEFRFGAGRPFRSFLMITIGTGIGGGIVLDGKLWAGDDGFAGEFGHITVEPKGHPCPCGNSGCVEQYSSSTAIVAAARETGCWPAEQVSTKWLADVAAGGDRRATELFADAGRSLGVAAAAVVNLLNPGAIIIGGGVAESFQLIVPAMLEEMQKRAFSPAMDRIALLRAELGDDAGILGAAALAFSR